MPNVTTKNTTDYKIESGIPFKPLINGRHSDYKYPFHLMKKGDSFRSKTGKNEHARVRQAMAAHSKRNPKEIWKSHKEQVGKHHFVRVHRLK